MDVGVVGCRQHVLAVFSTLNRPGTAAAVIYGGCTETGRYQYVVVVHLLWVNETWMNVFVFDIPSVTYMYRGSIFVP
jgi:hypothetical protein